MIAKLVECTDYKMVYGLLEVKDVNEEEVQNKIYEIKNEFYENDIYDWTIEDVFEKFPYEWEWTYHQTDCTLEI